MGCGAPPGQLEYRMRKKRRETERERERERDTERERERERERETTVKTLPFVRVQQDPDFGTS